MSRPLVSISCITYNHRKFIEKCLDGFLEQKGDFSFEILIHDDASTDGTAEIIKEYQKKYPEIVKPIFQKVNQWSLGQRGMNARYNFERAKGEFIALCEGDDYWIDNFKLQKQLDILKNNIQYSACFSDATIVDQEGVIVKDKYCRFQKGQRLTLKDIIGSSGGFYPTGSLLFRKNFDKLPSFALNYTSGDRVLALFLGSRGDLYFLNERTCAYRVHSGGAYTSIMNDNIKRNILRRENISLLKQFNSYTDFKYDKEFKESISGLSKLTLINLENDKLSSRDLKLIKNLKPRDFLSFIFRYTKNLGAKLL